MFVAKQAFKLYRERNNINRQAFSLARAHYNNVKKSAKK